MELRYAGDTDAAAELTNQRDVTESPCGAMFNRVKAWHADQGLILNFPSGVSVAVGKQPNDELVREIFLPRWPEGASAADKESVTFLLENALQSGKEPREAVSMHDSLETVHPRGRRIGSLTTGLQQKMLLMECKTLKRISCAVLAAALCVPLAGCDYLRHDVTLAGVWDTEAATILTSQEDVTAQACEGADACVEAFSSDQADAFKFSSKEDADAARIEGDVQIRDIFIIRWKQDIPSEDKEYVEYMLRNSGTSE
ncbi:hypothetical protein [Pseudoclavibacter sp. RFBA6]|uniref:hypothetical protein n=1 Tax=Pseudoclavibacter sp. RFBA6 TaxID=2080573 RepID=UPI0011B0D0AB|nr:hypothetical protein [Pseudoclavibacter sp. RFBA6]